MKRNASGFSLIELIIVIAIISIVITVANLSLNTYSKKSALRMETEEIRNRFTQLALASRNESRTYTVVFYPSENKYRVTAPTVTWPAPINVLPAYDHTFYISDPRVRFSSVNFSGTQTIQFLARGTVQHIAEPQSNAGTVILTTGTSELMTLRIKNPAGKMEIIR